MTNKRRFLNKFSCVLFLLAAVGVGLPNLMVSWQSRSLVFSDPRDLPFNTIGLVLGTDRLDGIKHRSDAAASLFRQGKIEKILVSGSPSNHGVNECKEFEKALRLLGVPGNKIILDEQGTKTLKSVQNLGKFQTNRNVTIITEDYHLGRAVFLARQLGWEGCGFVAPSHLGFWTKCRIYPREMASRVKAVLETF